MDWHLVLGIFFRWLHLATAATAVGAVFFMRIIVPPAMAKIDPPTAAQAAGAMRRGLKMTIHICIVLFLGSGVYNLINAMQKYDAPGVKPLGDILIGIHLLLALGVFALALILLAGPKAPRWAARGMTINLILLFAAIAAASSVKWVREHPRLPPPPELRGK